MGESASWHHGVEVWEVLQPDPGPHDTTGTAAVVEIWRIFQPEPGQHSIASRPSNADIWHTFQSELGPR